MTDRERQLVQELRGLDLYLGSGTITQPTDLAAFDYVADEYKEVLAQREKIKEELGL